MSKEHSQKPGIDNNDTFTPVGDKVFLRLDLAFTLHLYGNLKEKIYMSNQRVFMTDRTEAVYFQDICIAWRNRKENGT